MVETRHELSVLWRSVNREIGDRFRQAFRHSDMHPGMLMVLKQIQHEPGVTLNELARRSGVAKSHVSKMVDQAVKQELVEKRPDPADQRLVRLFVTQSGLETMAPIEARAKAVWAAVTDAIPEGQAADVHRGLQILLDALERTRSPGDQPDSEHE
ncbi:MAG TPA: MarR family winged helix-turn-helix transcriptional regulator [Symbiobacteriaceae bacterium]|jgi:DNA-binding MarR family transcriptional regulator|nr:MarR family winged helix-turn-helix transcriptional regulator [Symbiobacteriaceae bacterium]